MLTDEQLREIKGRNEYRKNALPYYDHGNASGAYYDVDTLLSHIAAQSRRIAELEGAIDEARQEGYERGCNEGYLHGRQDQYNGG